jgi:hypothetical protein
VVTWEDVDELQREMMGKVEGRIARLIGKIAKEAQDLREKINAKRYRPVLGSNPITIATDEVLMSSSPPVPPSTPSSCLESPAQGLESQAELESTQDDGLDCSLLRALMEEPTTESTEEESEYWQTLYRLLDPDRVPLEPLPSSLLDSPF